MFTGIIESTGIVKSVTREGTNLRMSIESSIGGELKVDQSVSHNGVCLTVVNVSGSTYEVVAVQETLNKTNLNSLNTGSVINLERCMRMNGRLDGHIVQGHVDTTATIEANHSNNGSWDVHFRHEVSPTFLTVEKGSVCVNGVSLTVVESTDSSFSVTIIPYTWEHTNFQQLKNGDRVNVEFDIIGKYVARLINR
jgi:riboflavin synthase